MGIQDRDYMRRPAGNRRRESDHRLETFFSSLLRRYPRLPMIVAGVIAGLILAGILVAILGG